MLKSLLLVPVLLIIGTFSNTSFSQVTILASDLTNPPANSCTNTLYTVSGNLANSNYGYSGPTIMVTGFAISVEMNYFSGFAPMPGLTPFSEDIDLGILPEGFYSVTTTGMVDGVATSVDTGSFNVETCCTGIVDLGIDFVICDTATVVLDATMTGATAYNWQDGSTFPTFIVTATGDFWVEVSDSIGCTYVDSISVTLIDCSLSLEQNSLLGGVQIAPNPARATFQLVGLKEEAKVTIFNLNGEAVDFHRMNTTIDVSGISNGIYIVKIEYNGRILTSRLMLQE